MNKLNENLLNCINIFLEIKDTNKLCKVSRFLRDCIKNSNQLRKIYYVNLLKKGNKKNFINKNFSNLVLTNLELSKITFWHCNFINTTFKKCDMKHDKFGLYTTLTNCKFIDCDLSNSRFDYTIVSKTSFTNCLLQNSKWLKCEYNRSTKINKVDLTKHYLNNKYLLSINI